MRQFADLPVKNIHILWRTSIQSILTLRVDAGDRMSNLTIRLNPEEKGRLKTWSAVRGASATDSIKALVAADMEVGMHMSALPLGFAKMKRPLPKKHSGSKRAVSRGPI